MRPNEVAPMLTVGLGLDLSCPADNRNQVLPHNLGRKHLGISGLGAHDGEAGNARSHQDRA